MTDEVTLSEFAAADGTRDWRVVSDGACAFFRTGSFAESARFVAALADLPLDGHPPAVDIRADGVSVRTVTERADLFGLTTPDLDLARRVSEVAREHGLTAEPAAIQGLLIIPGAPDTKAIRPFWQAVLGYRPREDSPDEDLVDPRDRGVPVWFEGMDEPRADGGGAIHLAVWIPFEEAEARVAAALAAGGRMVRDEYAPRWWTLADAAGNEVDIATVEDRG